MKTGQGSAYLKGSRGHDLPLWSTLLAHGFLCQDKGAIRITKKRGQRLDTETKWGMKWKRVMGKEKCWRRSELLFLHLSAGSPSGMLLSILMLYRERERAQATWSRCTSSICISLLPSFYFAFLLSSFPMLLHSLHLTACKKKKKKKTSAQQVAQTFAQQNVNV